MATRFFIPFYTIRESSYNLLIDYKNTKVSITMNVKAGLETTDDIPGAVKVLQSQLPNIFTSQCFNDLNLSFREEAAHTEIGHLFEHILLEYLCVIKASLGCETVEFSGLTRWNWRKNPRGTFAIDVSTHKTDWLIFNTALKKTILLMNMIFEKSRTAKRYSPSSLSS